MARVTQAEKARTRERLIQTAAREFRANGVAGSSIPTLMDNVGLTHGTFYAYFANKDELVAASCARGLEETVTSLMRRADAAPPGQELRAVIERYLSAEHRDDPARGCVLPALAGEIRRETAGVRHAFTEALTHYFDQLAPLLSDPDPSVNANREVVLASGMVGAILLARAVDDPALSDHILNVCRDFYLAAFAPPDTAETAQE